MFGIPLSDDPTPNKQQHPPMIRKETGPGYPKEKLVANRKTRCERCAFIVWQQFSWCELPCARGGVSPACWQVCVFCGAMRCDPPPVMRNTQPLQPCICDYPNGERGWSAAQAGAAARCTRLYRK